MQKFLASMLVILALGLTAGCSGKVTVATPTPEPIPAVTHTSAPAPTPTLITEPDPTSRPTPDPRNATDNRLVNDTINQLLDLDVEGLAAKFKFIDVPCTTADGLGGPPKCPEGTVDGTILTVFPVSAGEGSYFGPDSTPEEVAAALIAFDNPTLFRVILIEPSQYEEFYFPNGVYAVILEFDAAEQGGTFRLDAEGHIVRVDSIFWELEMEAGGIKGEVLYRP